MGSESVSATILPTEELNPLSCVYSPQILLLEEGRGQRATNGTELEQRSASHSLPFSFCSGSFPKANRKLLELELLYVVYLSLFL